MNQNPIKSEQTANTSPFLVWVEDYRKLNQNDKSEFIGRFTHQHFGIRKKQYGRGIMLQWVGESPKTLPPLEVAKWCTTELSKMHAEIEALKKGRVIEPIIAE